MRKTLIAVKGASGYAVSRIRKIDSSVELTALGSFSSEHVPVIGRVGIPDPQLGITWKNSMPFYGKWFDDIGETDPGYRIRKKIFRHYRIKTSSRRSDEMSSTPW